jgi:hypothetical protein
MRDKPAIFCLWSRLGPSLELSMSAKFFVAVLSSAALLAGQAMAASPGATIATVKGEVSVMGGKGTAAAKPGVALKAGDRVLVRQGQATVRFTDGCEVKLAGNSMALVGAQSPCASGKGVVSVQSADAAQWWKVNGGWNTGTVIAGIGSIALIGAFAYGLTNPTKCDGVTEADGQCTPSP